ncbi:F0F1 ATP synthase subunit delta [Sphingobacterium hotanense]|uniref:ATP synthase subunit delta n=1 Tax=Sphingobacterium hotanense TaxID=649196 RepID=A0ABT7NT61_9SPHI|nr:F0F1 ATP synthase subunit delta [Sphingobacterium hotanense]MDM1050392.1 F0F1 ATP synthase subunit delta [Sphingobacterium hotanense]
MSVFKVASRYAKSLIDLSKEHNNLDEIKGDMEEIVSIIKSSTELQAVLKNPIIKTDKKLAILNALFQGKVKPEIIGFFNIMVKKGRAELVFATAQEFIAEYNEVKGIMKAEVTSAAPLSEDNLQALRTAIAQQINKEVILSNKVDKSLIGGFVVRVGDRQIDASINGKLEKLERHFAGQN